MWRNPYASHHAAASVDEEDDEHDEEEDENEEEEDDDDDNDEGVAASSEGSAGGRYWGGMYNAAAQHQAQHASPNDDEEDEEEEEEVEEEEEEEDDNSTGQQDGGFNSETTYPAAAAINYAPRGKPEAMTAALSRANAQAARQELNSSGQSYGEEEDDDDEMEEEEAEVVMAEPVEEDVVDDAEATTVIAAAATIASVRDSVGSSGSRKSSAKKAPPKKSAKRKAPAGSAKASASNLLNSPSEPISETEYENLESLMQHFCRVPLLAEFSRPVALLHPELANSYSKIVSHPVDLGHVCRGIRRRQYKCKRDIRLDMWRVFANCVKFHSHPHNKEAVPSFVSIALHLREYFNCLWQEYMLPSEAPKNVTPAMIQSFTKRSEERERRLENMGVLMMSKKFLLKVSGLVQRFLDNGGRVDRLDEDPVFGKEATMVDKATQNSVVQCLEEVKAFLEDNAEKEEEPTIEEFHRRLKQCCVNNFALEHHPGYRSKLRNRIDRFLGKLTVPLHEANSRGVTQSSIWGNIATTIWARESSKKPYWPALCLGILPPADQREGWHGSVTERNEARLPEKLRSQLMGAKKKCEAQQKRLGLSFFLVEFLGTHEFIWVRETDIVEKFDPKEDPNKESNVKKRGRASRSTVSSVVGSKTYATALEECEWATDEFEQVLHDAFDYDSEKEGEDDGEFMNYSYSLLNQSDEEADREDRHGYVYDESDMSLSDVEEANWLLDHEGKLDTSAIGRKNAKKRTQALKKKAADKEKKVAAISAAKEKKKRVAESKQREREESREKKDQEKRRKKRTRERERHLKEEQRKNKKKRVSGADEGVLVHDKRARATAIVQAYVMRMARKDRSKDSSQNGPISIPASAVDSSGLLAMALAFRVAAGELAMPDDDGKPKSQPWELLDAESPSTHQERTSILEQKVKLLELEIEKVEGKTARRRELIAQSLAERGELERKVQTDDDLARVNHFRKKKKSVGRGRASDAASVKSDDGAREVDSVSELHPHDDDDDATEADEVEEFEN